MAAFYVISKKEFKNSLIWPLLGHLKVEKSAKIMIFAIFIQIFLSLFFRILAFFFKKLRIKSTLSTNSKKKFKNSLIQPRTSRSNFGKNSFNFEKIGPGEGAEAALAALAALEAAQMRPRASRATTKNCFLSFLSFFSLACLFFCLCLCSLKFYNILNAMKFNEIQ